jgi:hypothetical protein
MLILVLGSVACSNKQRSDAESVIREWVGKEIRFPILQGDTARVLDSLLNIEYKVLFYVDSIGCTSCRLSLEIWNLLIQESNEQLNGRMSFLFFFQPKYPVETTNLISSEKFYYPVFIDVYNRIGNINHFPKDTQYHCFLLNKENKVLLIGNPADNLSLWNLYKEVVLRGGT